MDLHLVIAGILLPRQTGEDPYKGLRLPALETLLSRASITSSEPRSLEPWLCNAFGMQPDQDVPVAPLTLTADGMPAEDFYWLRADPVHLQVDGDTLVLADSSTLGITHGEAIALAETLNAHFSAQDMRVFPLRPERWYIRLGRAPDLQTHPLPEMHARNIGDHLPQGKEGMRWQILFTEIQMLFHDHPVNVGREKLAAPLVNSVWFWGGGKLPRNLRNPWTTVWADHPVARGLALASGASPPALPENAEACTPLFRQDGESLVVLDTLRGATRYSDLESWRAQLNALERDWFRPLLEALKRKQLSRMHIHCVDGSQSQGFRVNPGDLWKFWRGRRPISALATVRA